MVYRLKPKRLTDSDPKSICHQHQIETGHHMDFQNVEILDTADNDFKLKMKELLHIVCHKPSLNRQLNPQTQFNINNLIIAAYSQLFDGEGGTP